MNLNVPKLIAFVSDSCWAIYNFRMLVIDHLQKKGFTILVIAPLDDYTSQLRKGGCLVESVTMNNRTLSPYADLQYFIRLKKLYHQYQPKLIFHYVIKPNIYGTYAAAAEHIPSIAVITGLGHVFGKQNWLTVLVINLYRLSLQKSSQVWFLNHEDAEHFLAKHILTSNKIQVLPGEGVDTNYFRLSETTAADKNDCFTFIMSCRLLYAKGVAEYAEASRILRLKGYRFNCLLMGKFESNHPDAISSTQLDLWQQSGFVHYLGFVSDVRTVLNVSHCCVLPSYYHEGVPRSLMEAASMELPIITTQTPGCRELVEEGKNGYFCAPRNAADLAEKMEKILLLEEHTRNQMGHFSRDLVTRKFSFEMVASFYDHAIASLITDLQEV